jgi:hypothetical protein
VSVLISVAACASDFGIALFNIASFSLGLNYRWVRISQHNNSFLAGVIFKINCTQTMKLIIYYDNVMDM